MYSMLLKTMVHPANTYSNTYQTLELIGQGGSASIWRGRHLYSCREVAIKVPRPHIENAAYTLYRESRIIARLHHPHVIRMHKRGMQNGRPFLILDYAPYGDLRHRYAAHQLLSLSTVSHFVAQICAGLQYIHDKGLIHCDIKPENMLLLRPDHLVISDFGIARSAHAGDASEKRAGTIRYMAPEQLTGIPCRASDQYALAVLVYEWLCGVPPFTGTPLQVMQQHISARPPELRNAGRRLPMGIEYVLQKALAKNPALRFSCVAEFCNALLESAKLSCFRLLLRRGVYGPAYEQDHRHLA